VKNAFSTSLYIQLDEELARRIPDAPGYRERAKAGWAWYQRSAGPRTSCR
jgi:hypothetical protein